MPREQTCPRLSSSAGGESHRSPSPSHCTSPSLRPSCSYPSVFPGTPAPKRSPCCSLLSALTLCSNSPSLFWRQPIELRRGGCAH
ncbi:hypothetical protein K469DRAFT_120186 [Zopfia rhizophila CBS 207.26]|uniref:Uncharacterized protein n=1 Tax=Zopfia rhizophila CBS 207.26 TaxID=1314779 RepID=A0A6A6E8P1_9PEZI|nr:hypothetical protein K469DRAFT_120186 [Zopfia rhizophila CBS 207.26]